jgi:hypothetical protein
MSAPAEAQTTSAQGQPTRVSSRRALLGAGVGALAATLASALGRATPSRAADGQTVVIGGTFSATKTTQISNMTTADRVFRAVSQQGVAVSAKTVGNVAVFAESEASNAVRGISQSGSGVGGISTTGNGVGGLSTAGMGVNGVSFATNKAGVAGSSTGNATGVLGSSGPTPPAAKGKTGVYGHAVQDSSSRGVWGRSNSGQGVFGEATTGVGVSCAATTGYALQINGRLRVGRVSGVASIPAGAKSVTVTPDVAIATNSFVLLTPKANIASRALWFTTDAAANTFTIRMSSSRTSTTAVAWLLIEYALGRVTP